ncbi:MAG: hypothetical protein HC895_00670 [Leptolyngbyaceae cyanobacterium SM1_3_5]|nr:hypothetical protein [Leptolyngbyaceae cyanobacterium SM1_3_5]
MSWHPFNKYCWDFWFAWHEGVLHVFYLQADRLSAPTIPIAVTTMRRSVMPS